MSPIHPVGRAVFQAILTHHVTRYPAMRLEDVYKLVHQAALGSEHAVSDWGAAQRWLEQELAGLGEGPAEPLLDPISPDACILRVHLWPFVASSGDVAQLLEAFVRTASEYRGSTAQLQVYWTNVEEMAATGRLPFQQADVQDYWRQMELMGYPAAHHSAVYKATYRPAYRVVAYEFLPETWRRDSLFRESKVPYFLN